MMKLAINGGKPVRETPLPSKMLGASLIGKEELKELEDVVSEKSPFRHYGIGNPQKVTKFEEEVRKMLGVKFALGVSSGSAALFCAVAALGIGCGDEVIMPAFGWYSDFNAVACAGALPVFADIDETMNIDPADFERKITKKTKAVIVIHYQGCPAKMDEIMSIARANNILVIEDCAQAFGGQYNGKFLGTMGDVGIVSFQANKLITCGEGGLFITNNEEYFARAVRYHDLGLLRPVFAAQIEDRSLTDDEKSFAGCQFRMGELQGAFLLAQLRKLPGILERCRAGHARIREAFKDNGRFAFRPFVDGDCGITVFMRFKNAKEAEAFGKALAAEGITIGPSSSCCNLLERYPIKSQKMYRDDTPPLGKGCAGEKTAYESSSICPNTNKIISEYVAVPIGALYSDEDIEDIIKAIDKVLKGLYS